MKRIVAMVLICSFLVICFSACTTKLPILMYKDSSEKNPDAFPLRAGIIIVNTQALDGIKVDGGMAPIIPLVPLYMYSFRAEFPKGKETEFLADMVRQYFLDVGVFDYTYNYPFKKTDVDIIIELKLNKFHLYNDKLLNYLMNQGMFIPIPLSFISPIIGMVGSLVGSILPLFIKEKYTAEYDFELNVLRPDGKRIKNYKGYKKDSDTVGSLQAYGEYLWYKSVFKKCFLSLMNDLKDKMMSDRDEIIQAYKKFLTE